MTPRQVLLILIILTALAMIWLAVLRMEAGARARYSNDSRQSVIASVSLRTSGAAITTTGSMITREKR